MDTKPNENSFNTITMEKTAVSKKDVVASPFSADFIQTDKPESKIDELLKKYRPSKEEIKQDILNKVAQKDLQTQVKEKVKDSSPVITTPNFYTLPEIEKDENEEEKPKPKVDQNFRAKLFAITCAIIIFVVGAWVITASVQLNNYSSALSAINQEISTIDGSISNYLYRVSTIDDATQEDDTYIEAIIGVETPTPEDSVDFLQETNWFDRLCNWFSNLFR